MGGVAHQHLPLLVVRSGVVGEAEFADAVNSALQAGPSRYQADTGIGLVDDLASTLVNDLSLVNMNEEARAAPSPRLPC